MGDAHNSQGTAKPLRAVYEQLHGMQESYKLKDDCCQCVPFEEFEV